MTKSCVIFFGAKSVTIAMVTKKPPKKAKIAEKNAPKKIM